MCLSLVTSRKRNKRLPITAWKVYWSRAGILRSPILYEPVHTDEWISVTQKIPLRSDSFCTFGEGCGISFFQETKIYESGFHCFLSEESAEMYCRDLRVSGSYDGDLQVFRVKIKGDLTFGADSLLPDAVVASKLYICIDKPNRFRRFWHNLLF